MSRGLQSLLIVLLIAALLSGAAVTRYSTAGRPRTAEQRSNSTEPHMRGEPDVAGNNSTKAASSPNVAYPPGNNPAGKSVAADSSAESFQDWFQKYRAVNPDDHRLRRELEAALAQLPSEKSPSDAVAALEALRRAEQIAGDDYPSLLDQAERFLAAYPNGAAADQVRALYAKYSRAWDERDFEAAREFSRANPDRFESRIARYQEYLERHAAVGLHVADARVAVESIRTDWAETDYRAIYDFHRRYPNDVVAVTGRVRRYVEDHPSSHRRAVADQFLARYEKAAAPGEYRLRVKSASFARSIGRTLSLGPDLAVEVEVAGVRIGRTPIVADSFEPVWDYEFPQNIRWRVGDPVKIRVIDFDYTNHTILKIETTDDPMALRYLSGTLNVQGHRLTFECDFQEPSLPAP
jgi:hypothetical protein